MIAKLDRLTRNARFLLGIVESGAEVVFCELPDIPPGPMGKFFLTMMAAVAEHIPDPAVMVAFLDQLDAKYGGVEGWLSRQGVPAQRLERFRSAMLEPAA